jgi:hypothetical protein
MDSEQLNALSDEELTTLHTNIGSILEERTKVRKDAAKEKIAAAMAEAGLSPRDFVVPSVRSVSGRAPRPSSRIPKFGKDLMLPALQKILKNGPLEQNVLRNRLKDEFGMPLNVIGMMIRYDYVKRTSDGRYELGEAGKVEVQPPTIQ